MGLDEQLFLWVNEAFSGAIPTALMSFVTWLGNGLVLAVLVLPAMYLKDRETFRRHVLPMVLAVVLSAGAVTVTKAVVGRPRPPEHFAGVGVPIHVPHDPPPDRSFPSGHAQTAFGVAVYLCCLYPAATPALLLAASLVALSRVALGVHFPSDVLVGSAAGALTSLATFLLVRRGRRPRVTARARPSRSARAPSSSGRGAR